MPHTGHALRRSEQLRGPEHQLGEVGLTHVANVLERLATKAALADTVGVPRQRGEALGLGLREGIEVHFVKEYKEVYKLAFNQ